MRHYNVDHIHSKIEGLVTKLDEVELAIPKVKRCLYGLLNDLNSGAHKYRSEILSAMDLRRAQLNRLWIRKGRLTALADALSVLACNIQAKLEPEEFEKIKERWDSKSRLRGRIVSQCISRKAAKRFNGKAKQLFNPVRFE